MKLVRTLTFAGLAAGSLTALLLGAQGCSSSSAETTESSSSSTSSTKSSTTSSSSSSVSTSGSASASKSSSAVPTGTPPAPTGPATTSTKQHNFAMHHLYLGDSDPGTGKQDANAWKAIGYNIDGLVTTASSTNVCTPYTHGQLNQQVDGDNGIDNAFGAIIVNTILGSLVSNLSETVTDKITSGSFTIEIDTTGLTGATQTNTALSGLLFAGGTYPGTPPLNAAGTSFAISDNWPVSPSLLKNGMTVAGGSKISFPAAYVTNGTWVSGSPVQLGLSLTIEGESLTLTIHNALLSFQYSVDASGQGHATNGIISGVLETTEFVAAINELGGQIMGGTLCTVLEGVEQQIDAAQDLIIDPTSGAVSNTAGTPCNGISIGLAFDADEIALPMNVATPTDAGTPLPACGASSSGTGTGTTSSTGTGNSSSGTGTGSGTGSSTGTGTGAP